MKKIKAYTKKVLVSGREAPENLTRSVGLFFYFGLVFYSLPSTDTDEYTRYACSETSLHAAHSKITDLALLYSTLHVVQASHRKN